MQDEDPTASPVQEEEGQRRVFRERHHLLQGHSFHLFVVVEFMSYESCTFTRLHPYKNVTIWYFMTIFR